MFSFASLDILWGRIFYSVILQVREQSQQGEWHPQCCPALWMLWFASQIPLQDWGGVVILSFLQFWGWGGGAGEQSWADASQLDCFLQLSSAKVSFFQGYVIPTLSPQPPPLGPCRSDDWFMCAQRLVHPALMWDILLELCQFQDPHGICWDLPLAMLQFSPFVCWVFLSSPPTGSISARTLR